MSLAAVVTWRQQPRQMIGEIQRDAAVALAERLDATQTTSPAAAIGVEIGGVVALDPRRQDLGLENRRRKRRALQLFDRIEQRVGAAPPLDDSLPGRREPAEHRLIDRLDFVAQLGERAPPQHAAARRRRSTRARCRPAGTRLRAGGLRPSAASARASTAGTAEPVARRDVGGGERRVRPRVAQREVAERIGAPAASSDSGMPGGSGTPSASR